VTDKQHCDGHDSAPESDDIDYFPTPHRHLVILAGKCAQAEQQRLEKELGLQDGRTARPG
jgi:hypothetical protein